jgi:hypothetical protein
MALSPMQLGVMNHVTKIDRFETESESWDGALLIEELQKPTSISQSGSFFFSGWNDDLMNLQSNVSKILACNYARLCGLVDEVVMICVDS